MNIDNETDSWNKRCEKQLTELVEEYHRLVDDYSKRVEAPAADAYKENLSQHFAGIAEMAMDITEERWKEALGSYSPEEKNTKVRTSRFDDLPRVKARFICRQPDPGVLDVFAIDWAERRVSMTNGLLSYFADFEQIEIIDELHETNSA